MLIKIYKFPVWFMSHTDKPDYLVFQKFLNDQSNYLYARTNCTVSYPTLTEVEIQWGSTEINGWFQGLSEYNYIQITNDEGTFPKYYQITQINSISNANYTVQIEGTIDIYLTLMVSYFNPNNLTNTNMVWFNQKHLNRYAYPNGEALINYDQQFYLLSQPPQLKNVGSKLMKKTFYANNDFTYISQDGTTATGNPVTWASQNYYANGSPMLAYPVILWKMTSNETNQANQSEASGYPFPFAFGGLVQTTVNNQFEGTPWYALITSPGVASDYYTDVYLLPVPLGCLYTNSSLNQITTLQEFIGQNWYIQGVSNGNWQFQIGTSSDPSNCAWSSTTEPLLTLNNGNHLYAIPDSSDWMNSFPEIQEAFLVEPACANYERYNVRMYGQDNTILPTSFGGYQLYNKSLELMFYLCGFCLTVSPPNLMLTNIPWVDWQTVLSDTGYIPGWMSDFYPWNYNQVNDAIYSCNLKATAPSGSTAWNNYMAQHKNNYDMALNIASLEAQRSQTEVSIAHLRASYMEASFLNPLGDVESVLTGNFITRVGDTMVAKKAVGVALDNELIADANMDYYKTGMKGDMSRTSNMRVSATSTINTLYDSSFVIIREYLPNYEATLVINWHAMNGYILERYDQWMYWYNRQYCNYVKCTNWCNALGIQTNLTYKALADKLISTGFRVWSNLDNTQWNTPYGKVLINDQEQTYTNTEVNQNDNELNLLVQWNNSSV